MGRLLGVVALRRSLCVGCFAVLVVVGRSLLLIVGRSLCVGRVAVGRCRSL